ncbi:hypothetical protein IAT38_001515 [Cryptococcus sp. DSM 104549]
MAAIAPSPHSQPQAGTDASLPSSPGTSETNDPDPTPSLGSYPSAYSLSSTAINHTPSGVETGLGSPDGKDGGLALGDGPAVLVVGAGDEAEEEAGEEARDGGGEEEEDDGREKKSYDPPRNPLTPAHLRRIAGTFGIVIPDMPDYSLSLPTPLSPTPSDPTRSPTLSTTTSIGGPGASPATSRTPGGRLSPLLSPRGLGTPHQVRSTGYLLAVIPPLILLPPSATPSTPAQQRQRERKWRRGALLPLQPTLGSMLVCIAREWNLPSTVGISVYLVMPTTSRVGTPVASPRLGYDDSASAIGSAASAYGDEEEEEEPDGPRVSASTWSTLFAPHLLQNSSAAPSSRAGTPSQTPVKPAPSSNGAGARGEGGVPFPLVSPLLRQGAMAGQQGQKMRSLSLGPLAAKPNGKHRSHPSTSTAASARSHRHTPSSGSSASPPLPTSASLTSTSFLSPNRSPNPIVGTIEFDIDLDEAAGWFEGWKKAGGGRRWKKVLGGGEGGGVRELGLVKKMEESGEGRPRFVKEMAEEKAREEAEAHAQAEAAAAAAEEDQNVVITQPPDDPASSASSTTTTDPEVIEVARLLDAEGVRREDLLASPIQLGGGFPDQSPAAKRVQQVLERRWSGLVMSEQLDDLEKIMRQLSPREIRLTSPRYMTPRMAEKVANSSHELLPEVPRRGTSRGALGPLSPLAAGFTTPQMDGDEEREEAPVEKREDPRQEEGKAVEEDDDLVPPQRAWPSIPFRSPSSPARSFSSIASPTSPNNHQFFHRPSFPQRNASSPSSLSEETMQRMQSEAVAQQARGSGGGAGAGSEWVPRRPARPPSPKLEHQRTLSHTLSSDLVDFLAKSPTAPGFSAGSGTGAGSPTGRGFGSPKHEVPGGAGLGMGAAPGVGSPREEERQRKASGISLKTLRHQMSAKNLKWGSGGGKEGQGLGMGMPSPTEFGGVLEDHAAEGSQEKGDRASTSASLPSRSSKFASRILHPTFGFRRHDDEKHGAAGSSSALGTVAGRQRRNPSVDSHLPIQISSPITGSLTHSRSGSGSLALPESATLPTHPIPGRPSMQAHTRSGSHPTVPSPSALPQAQAQARAPLPGSKSAANLAHLAPSASASYSTLPGSQSYASNLGAHGHGAYGAYPQPGSPGIPPSPGTPASPRSVRRKPVPGMDPAASNGAGGGNGGVGLGVNVPGEDAMKSSLSLGSMASFVLEDPPKGRRGMGAGTAA